MERARPPADILPSDFFLHWVPEIVAQDTERQQKLGDTRATVVFHLTGAGGGSYTVRIESGRVEGREGAAEDPDLHVHLDVATWRRLNNGETSAPQAVLKRQLRFEGSFLLGLKLHLILA
jgi:putative sterol carrier protein